MAQNKSKLKAPTQESSKRLTAPPLSGSGSSENEPPAFCFQYIRSTYCLTLCPQEEQAALAMTLYELSRLTWAQIHGAHRHEKGCEKIARTSIHGDSIPGHITEDVNLWAFRFCGLAAMVGFRSGRIFHIVWLDRDFTLYKH